MEQKSEKYWQNLRIEKPKDFNDFFLKVRNKYKLNEYSTVCAHIIQAFREGKLGPVTLD
jgi:ribosome biogenesis GTPase A